MTSTVNLAKWLIQAFSNPLSWATKYTVRARVPYTGDELRELRAKRGVGRPPITGEWDNWARAAQADHVNQMAAKWRWKQPQRRVWKNRANA